MALIFNSHAEINKIINARKKQKHRKSKLGCLNCRQRRIKCGEELDVCYNCLDRNLRCSFLDLSESEKQAILRQHKEASVHNEAPIYDHHDKELQSLSSGNFYFNVEKLSLGKNSGISKQGHRKSAGGFFSKLDFTQSCSSPPSAGENGSPESVSSKSPVYQHTLPTEGLHSHLNSNMGDPAALPGHLYQPTSFSLIQVTRTSYRDYKATFELCTACGEDDAAMSVFKNQMAYWFFDMSCVGIRSSLAFHTVISRACYTILNQFVRPSQEEKPPAKIFSFLKRYGIYTKLQGLKLAQKAIELLNKPHKISSITYFKLIKSIFNYSSITFSLALFSDNDFKNVITFIDGFISTATMKQLAQQVYVIADSILDKQSSIYDEVHSVRQAIEGSAHFHSQHINSVIIPNYNLDIFHEFHYELSELIMLVQNSSLSNVLSNLDNCKPSTLMQARELANLIEADILTNRNLLDKSDPRLVCMYEPLEIFNVLRSYLFQYPSENMYLQDKAYSLSSVEILIYLFWYASGALLDSLLPESYFLFSTQILGIVTFNGYGMPLIDQTFQKLESEFKDSDYQLYDKLYKKAVYVFRTASFLRYRFTIYLRNVNLGTIFPTINSSEYEKLRFESRKIKALREEHIHNFKNTIIQYQHYPQWNPNYAENPDGLDHLRPTRLDNLEFHDHNLNINVNFDEHYNQVQNKLLECDYDINKLPVEYIKLNQYGLIINIDFRPNLTNCPEKLFGDIDFKKHKHKLLNYLPDRNRILMLEIPRNNS